MFHYQQGQLYAEGVSLADLAAEYGTPLYIYSRAVLEGAYDRLVAALGTLDLPFMVCYALKANTNPALAALLAARGAGADVVSGGELYLAQQAGFAPERIVFAGVGKTRAEMAEALAAPGIRAFHVESRGELEALAEVAGRLGTVAPIAVRVNPDVDAHTHRHITTGTAGSKFGVPAGEARSLIRWAAGHPHLRPVGLHAHIGSQLGEVAPIIESTRRLLALWDALAGAGIRLENLDIGGGLAIPYQPGDAPEGPVELADGLRPLLAGRRLELAVEPGRYLAGPCGVLLTRVLYNKPGSDRQLLIADAGMNDLLRPALYEAYHPIQPVMQPDPTSPTQITDLAGPVCESSDFLATARPLPSLNPGALLAIGQAGAYGFVMGSQYNGRPRPAEVLVEGTQARLIRTRETYADLLPKGS
jgi:diaminopimelate decarboxylase